MVNYLITILEKSVEKNGEIPLTNKYLLNITKMVKKNMSLDEANLYEMNPDPNE